MNQHPNFAQIWQIFCVFLRLGCMSFGGPVAHLGWFRREFVQRRNWIHEDDFASTVALCQVLPGATSSQVGMLVGYARGGWAGAAAAWLGFTLPSALLMGTAGVLLSQTTVPLWIQIVCRLAALWIVAHAVWGMARAHCAHVTAVTLGLATLVVSALSSWLIQEQTHFVTWIPSLLILAGAMLGILFFAPKAMPRGLATIHLSHRAGVICLGMFVLFFVVLQFDQSIYSALYKVGALVFGGGHVVLPLIQQNFVQSGLLSPEAFATGYGLVQAMPGPLFTIGSFIAGTTGGWSAILPGTLVMFAPSVFLVFGLLPWWKKLQHFRAMQQALPGINAVVVGLLAQAWFHLVWELVTLFVNGRSS